MADFKLNLEELGKEFGKIAKFFINKSKTEIDNKLIESFSAEIAKEEDVEASEVISSLFALVKVVTKATKNKWDDIVVGSIESILNASGLLDKFEDKLTNIQKEK